MFRKKHTIAELKEGDIVEDVFVVKIKKGIVPYAKGFSFTLLLTDNSGKTIEYKYWGGQKEEEVRKTYDAIRSDFVVLIKGKVGMYSGKPQITTNPPDTIQVIEDGNYDPADFVKPARKDPEQMLAELEQYIQMAVDPKIKELLLKIINKPGFKERLKTHPGAIQIHHSWIGGLLEHTLEVLAYCKLSWELFPELDRSLLIAGAMLHDIGKMDEIEVTSRIKGTVEGQLIGHTILGTLALHDQIKDADIDTVTKTKLLHLIVSHLGKTEYGAGKPPMFAEAVVLNYADELSAKAAAILEDVADMRVETEDDFMFHNRERRNIFLR